MGANTTILSVVDTGWLRPLPFDDASALVSLWLEDPPEAGEERVPLTGADMADLRREPGLFAAVSGWEPTNPVLTGVDAAEVVAGAAVTEGMFSRVLRVHPLLGRTFLPDEDRPDAAPTVVLSHGFWSERFGGDPEAIGRSVVLDGVPHVVVGVMPPDFHPPFRPDAHLWTAAGLPAERCRRDCRALPAIARLAPGTTLPVARARATALTSRLAESHPETNAGITARLAPLGRDRSALSAESVRALALAGFLVLVIACVNVAVLLVARGLERVREMAIRSSVGATGVAMGRHLVKESVALALVGGLIGVGMAVWGIEGLERLAPTGVVGVRQVEVNVAILLASIGLAVAIGVLSGVVPAWLMARRRGVPVEGGIRLTTGQPRKPHGWTPAIVVTEVALAVVLAVGAGSVVQDLRTDTARALGVRSDGLLTMTVTLPADRYGDPPRRLDLEEALTLELEGMPGAFSVGVTGALPSDDSEALRPVMVEGEVADASTPPRRTRVRAVSEEYFYTVGQRMSEGRGFRDADGATAEPVAVLDATASRRLFSDPPRSPVGSRLAMGEVPGVVWRTVVGVVDDAPGDGVEGGPVVYVPLAQEPAERLTFLVRVDDEPARYVDDARDALVDVDPTLAPGRIAPLRDLVAEAQAGERFAAVLSSAFAVLALLLSVVGLYGVMAHDVSARLRELGLRKAVGATASDLRLGVLGRAGGLAALGVVIGSVVAGLLFRGSDPGIPWPTVTPPLVYAGVLTLVALAALLAALQPMHRSGAVDAVTALGRE